MIWGLVVAVGLLQTPIVLSIEYADGRTVRHVITANPTNGWTPLFPKTADWRSPEGLPVYAINYRHAIEGDGVRVRISLFLGSARQREIHVANVFVPADNRIHVTALDAYGVEPVTLSLGPFEPRMLAPPRVENKTASLHIESVEMSDKARPGYHVSVRNHASKAVLTFFVDSFRDGKPALSSVRGEQDSRPIVAVDETHSFFLATEHPLDLLRITGLMFEDGSIEGDPGGVATTRVRYLGRRLLLAEAISILREAAPGAGDTDPRATIAALNARIEALPVTPGRGARELADRLLPPDDTTPSPHVYAALADAMAATRRGMLGDVKEAPRERAAFAQWLRDITAQYQTWHQRFTALTTHP
jgi:hypothetical protein